MYPLYQLRVVAPDHTVFAGQVQSLVAPGSDGYFGVLHGHAPLLAELAAGEFSLVDEQGQTRYYAISGGFLEVSSLGEVTVVADAAEAAEDIDVTRAKAAEERARQRLQTDEMEVDQTRAQAALQRAMTRLRVVSRGRA